MKSYARDQMLPPGTAVLASVADLAGAVAAIGQGAGLIDMWAASVRTADAVRARYPDVPLCARAGWAGLVRDRAAALRTGAMLICDGPASARLARADGIGRDRLLLETPPALAGELLAGGWTVIVTADDEAGPHAAAAVAAIACWLGAAAVRTSHVTAARRAIDMTEAIKRGWSPGPTASR